jgi:hypothetical protein
MGPSGSGDSGDTLPLAEGVATAGAAAVTATVSSAAGGVHFVVVTTPAAAVSVTELTELAPDATGIWASRLTGCLSDTELTVQLAVLFPLPQPVVNTGFWLVGLAASVTDTSEAGPFLVETSTTNVASCPRLMLDCPRWTLTHSSGADVVAPAFVPELGGALEVALGLGLVARWASSDAAADDEVADDDGAADDGAADDGAAEEGAADDGAADDGAADEEGATDPDGEGDPETEDDADPDGDGSAAEPEIDADADGDPDADADAEGEGDGEGDGDGDGRGVGEGEGVGVLAAGSSSHVVSVLAEAVGLAEADGLAEAVELGEAVAVASPTGPASATPDQAASVPTVRKPPASKLSVVARTCAKRI